MGQTASQPTQNPTTPSVPTACPVDHTSMRGQFPVSGTADAAAPPPAQCPVSHSSSPNPINPLNQIPSDLAQTPAAGQSAATLPTTRVSSSIPRDHSGAVWEYPSPQQFYNALVRKGWETPEEDVETMVAIHNFLNEAAWDEVRKWEMRTHPSPEQVQLTRFRGRPGELSPKARFFMLAGWLLPSRFNTEPPFDRHDWIIRRPHTNEEVRYVIDYYSAPPEPDGSPAFSLDVRPALDSFTSVKDRITVATEEVWTQFKTRQASGRS